MAKFWRNTLQKKKRTGQKVIKWEAVTAICTFFLTLGVFVALYQVYVSKKVATFDFMARLDDEFNSERIQKTREITVDLNFTNHDANELVKCEPLLNYFEKIAYLEEKGMIPLEAVDAYWGYWIERYWVLCEDVVNMWRAESPYDECYGGYETLFHKLAKISYKKNKITHIEIDAYKHKIKKELEEFKMEEKQSCGLYVNAPQLSGRTNIVLDDKH
jgi:hypothetical protein